MLPFQATNLNTKYITNRFCQKNQDLTTLRLQLERSTEKNYTFNKNNQLKQDSNLQYQWLKKMVASFKNFQIHDQNYNQNCRKEVNQKENISEPQFKQDEMIKNTEQSKKQKNKKSSKFQQKKQQFKPEIEYIFNETKPYTKISAIVYKLPKGKNLNKPQKAVEKSFNKEIKIIPTHKKNLSNQSCNKNKNKILQENKQNKLPQHSSIIQNGNFDDVEILSVNTGGRLNRKSPQRSILYIKENQKEKQKQKAKEQQQQTLKNKRYLQLKSLSRQSAGRIIKNKQSRGKDLSLQMNSCKTQENNMKVCETQMQLSPKNKNQITEQKSTNSHLIKEEKSYLKFFEKTLALNEQLRSFSNNIKEQRKFNNNNEIKKDIVFLELNNVFNQLDGQNIGILTRFNCEINKCPSNYQVWLDPLLKYIKNSNKKMNFETFLRECLELMSINEVRNQNCQNEINNRLSFKNLNLHQQESQVVDSYGQSLESVVVNRYDIVTQENEVNHIISKYFDNNEKSVKTNNESEVTFNKPQGFLKQSQRQAQFEKQNTRFNQSLLRKDLIGQLSVRLIRSDEKDMLKQRDQLKKLQILNERLEKYLSKVSTKSSNTQSSFIIHDYESRFI